MTLAIYKEESSDSSKHRADVKMNDPSAWIVLLLGLFLVLVGAYFLVALTIVGLFTIPIGVYLAIIYWLRRPRPTDTVPYQFTDEGLKGPRVPDGLIRLQEIKRVGWIRRGQGPGFFRFDLGDGGIFKVPATWLVDATRFWEAIQSSGLEAYTAKR